MTVVSEKGRNTLDVPVSEHPGDTAIFYFPPAQVLTGKFSDEIEIGVGAWAWQPPSGSVGVQLTNPGKPIELARVVGKIGHGLAVLKLGLDGFEPFLPSIILQSDTNPWVYVGGDLDPPLPTKDPIHKLHVEIDAATGFVICSIRLFANFPRSPLYRVVAGNSNSRTAERLKPKPFYPEAQRRTGDGIPV